MAELIAQPHLEAYVTLAVIAAMFVLFVREVFPPEVTAFLAAAVLLATGMIPTGDLLSIFSNSAPWTIAAMFILSGGLIRTGVLNNVSRLISAHAGRRPALVIASLGVLVIVASAFMNNTPIVVVMLPIVVQLANALGLAPSKLLIPLSYATIMGGMCTLIGTSTNLLVDGVARAQGLAPFPLFEITPLGACLAVIGLAYLWLFVPRLLPNRNSMSDLLGTRKRMKFFTEVVVPEGSPLIGAKVTDVPIFKRDGMRVIDLLRGEDSMRREFPEVALAEGDRVVLRTDMGELLGLKDSNQVTLVDRVGSKSTTTVEALITPDCKLVGRSLGSLRLRRRYGVYPLAVHRRNQNIGRQLDDVVVRVGDTLLLEGAPDDIRRLAADVDLVNLAEPTARPFRRERAPLMLAVLAAVVGLSAFEVAPIHVLALLGVAVVLGTGILDSEEAFSYVDARLMVLIFAMLAVGLALDHTGAAQLIVDSITPWLRQLPPRATLVAVYLVTMLLTEVVTNNAVAVVMTPITIVLAEGLGIDPRALVVAVMFAASASFSTPIGYQTNTLVYGPGGYKFADFMRVGIPLNLLMAASTCILIPLFWPLMPG